MIGQLRGLILRRQPQELLLDVQGVGYRVQVPLSTFYRLGEEGDTATLRVRTVVREDAFQLFGFLSEAEESLFDLLVSVSGVGPRLAINILSGIEPLELAAALAGADASRLTRIPGVGRKTADRLVVELKDRVANLIGTAAEQSLTQTSELAAQELLSALLNLGYPRPGAARAAGQAIAAEPAGPFEAQLRQALRLLAR